MNHALTEYYRCPEIYTDTNLGEVSARDWFPRGETALMRDGRTASADPVIEALFELYSGVPIKSATYSLPLEPDDIIDNLRNERYLSLSSGNVASGTFSTATRNMYYLMRPLLPVCLRKHLQRVWLKGWEKISFPEWPVDRTVDRFVENLLALLLNRHQLRRIPFIWFWPDDYASCAIMTHDVETSAGLAFCSTLMDLDDSFGIKASFQLIPEGRYNVSENTLSMIHARGFEINIHDLNHDGHLYRNHTQFLDRVSRINRYADQYAAEGFRSAALYRNVDWYNALGFSYDMSVPNVAHLDPQRGGCCTVLPYFIGKILELPVTATQDYSLFHILGDYSTALWQKQLHLIQESHGLASFIVHPDYVMEKRAQTTYRALLEYLSRLRLEANVWLALPRDVNAWWRQRSRMKLVESGGQWHIEGPCKERARIAFATLDNDRVSYTLQTASPQGTTVTADVCPS